MLLNKEDKQRFQAFTGSAMYLEPATRYVTLFAVNRKARVMFKLSKTHMPAATYLLGYLAEMTVLVTPYRQRDFKPTASSGANWGNDPDTGKSTPSPPPSALKSWL